MGGKLNAQKTLLPVTIARHVTHWKKGVMESSTVKAETHLMKMIVILGMPALWRSITANGGPTPLASLLNKCATEHRIALTGMTKKSFIVIIIKGFVLINQFTATCRVCSCCQLNDVMIDWKSTTAKLLADSSE